MEENEKERERERRRIREKISIFPLFHERYPKL
jgi:hypothetical protein